MISEIHFEIASAGFLALLFFADLFKRQLHTKTTITFQTLLCILMLSTFFSIDCELSIQYGDSQVVNELIYMVSMFGELLCVMAIHCHIMALLYKLNIKSARGVVDSAIFIIIAMIVVTSPWTHMYFLIGADGNYHNTVIAHGIHVVMLLYLLVDFVLLWLKKDIYSIRRKVICSFLLAGFAALMFAEYIDSIISVYFNAYIVFFIYIYYLSLQSPDFYVDNATGAYNRNGFEENLRERIIYKQPTACFVVRVRNFGSMSSVYGEEILLDVQRMIRELLENHCEEETVYHVGASSFALIMDSDEDIQRMYEYLMEHLPTVWVLSEEIVNHEYSFYKILYPEDDLSYEEMMQRIHYARSDHEGHHKSGALIHLGKTAIQDVERTKEVAHLVDEAIMDNSIEINLQPIYSFSSDKITSVEVLARLKDREKNYINPEYFIHIAEENHSIIALGEQIFRKACIFASQNHIFDYGIEEMNINLSPTQCRYENLIERFVEIAEEYQVPMKHIHLEITESEFKDKNAVDQTLHRFYDKGVKVALDDFGTGFSTLSNILELPVDYVKIDKSLVWSYAAGKNQFLNDMMPMIKAEGKKIIAEGIENKEQMEMIKNLNGDYLQGYYFSKPLSETEFVHFLKKYNGFR